MTASESTETPHVPEPKPVRFTADQRYRWDDRWARVPETICLGITHGIDIDADGFVYVLHTVHETSTCRDAVCVFDPDGGFVRSWGAAFEGSGHGFQLREEDGVAFAYVTDLKRGLFKCTLDGEIVWHIERPSIYQTRVHLKYEPTNVALAPDGDVFLSDGYGSYLIHRFDKNGNQLDVFGGPGNKDHHLAHPHGLIYTERRGSPELLVGENIATRLNYLSLDGEHRGFLDVETRRPRHFAERDGQLLVPDFYGRITLIDEQDRLVTHLGDTWIDHQHAGELEKNPPAEGFIRPHDGAIDAAGRIYVSEYVATGRLVRLTPIED
ncbi:MAG: hypothetical protein AAF750_04630 [Planctomycetota bacterium]